MTSSFEQRFNKLNEGKKQSSFQDRFNKISKEKSVQTQNQSVPSFENRFNRLATQQSTLSTLAEPEEKFYDKLTPKPYILEKTSLERSTRQNVLDTYRPEEKTPEQLKAMSVQDRMQYAHDLQNLRELQSGTGLVKGALSGLTFGASEHIPGLKPDEDDLMVGLGETIGSYLPIAKLYNFIGKPIVNLAAKSPIARQGLEALGRMTGFGLTGAAYKGTKELVQGEVPDPAELAKEGATWAAIDAVLQGLGLGVAFQQSVSRIAEAEGVTAKEILGRLWNSTKNFLKQKFISPKNIGEPEIEILMQEAKQAEAAIVPETEIEIMPKEEIAKPEVKSDHQIDSDLTKAKNELVELERTQGKGATNKKSLLIQEINNLELEKYNRTKQNIETSSEKREVKIEG